MRRLSKKKCFFCQDRFPLEKDSYADDDMFDCEVGEFWSEELQDSVLAHPDCLPMGIDATQQGLDPNWKTA